MPIKDMSAAHGKRQSNILTRCEFVRDDTRA